MCVCVSRHHRTRTHTDTLQLCKASPKINLNEDIFAGYMATLRNQRITHKEFLQMRKGREISLKLADQFDAKLAEGTIDLCYVVCVCLCCGVYFVTLSVVDLRVGLSHRCRGPDALVGSLRTQSAT